MTIQSLDLVESMRECYSPADVVELTTRIRVIEENMKSLEEEYKRLLGSIRTQIIEHDNKNKLINDLSSIYNDIQILLCRELFAAEAYVREKAKCAATAKLHNEAKQHFEAVYAACIDKVEALSNSNALNF